MLNNLEQRITQWIQSFISGGGVIIQVILELFCVRFYVTLVNWSVVTYRYLIYGPFGISALCSFTKFPSEWYNDGGCGAYHGSVISAFRDVLKGMRNSR